MSSPNLLLWQAKKNLKEHHPILRTRMRFKVTADAVNVYAGRPWPMEFFADRLHILQFCFETFARIL
ncbi:UNVERIFIED_CONTAM: hypothetical protein Slati_2220100 [Sesamum latifolium]|uniref:Transposase n=1 Tax=Sesamum latifolium TaxID=2727402 RepID=A0AAW2WVM7_9LAMI